MNKSVAFCISVVLLAVGAFLIAQGLNANNSFNSQVSRFFTGSPTNKTSWFLISGAVACVLGLFGFFRTHK